MREIDVFYQCIQCICVHSLGCLDDFARLFVCQGGDGGCVVVVGIFAIVTFGELVNLLIPTVIL
jgi:hypothetical protein